MFFDEEGIIIRPPTQTSQTSIRNLYTDGFPGAADRPEHASRISCTMVGDFIECTIDDPEGTVHLPGPVTGLIEPDCPDRDLDDCE